MTRPERSEMATLVRNMAARGLTRRQILAELESVHSIVRKRNWLALLCQDFGIHPVNAQDVRPPPSARARAHARAELAQAAAEARAEIESGRAPVFRSGDTGTAWMHRR